MADERLTIGEVADRTGVAASALRYWEEFGLLPAPARVSGQRRYPPSAVEHVGLILLLREVGFTLREVKELVGARTSGGDWRELQRGKLAELDRQIARMQAARTAIAHGLHPGAQSPHRLVATAQVFQELMIDLRDYLAPGPPDAGIRMDILAARELLVQIAPLHRPTRPLTISDPTTRATLSALHGACEVMGQVARMNQGTFATLARSEQIHIPTRLLDGDILSDDPTTAQAKLTGVRRVIAPPTRVQQTLQHYEAIGAVTGHVAQYQPAVVHAADYDHPALFRQSEFEGRP